MRPLVLILALCGVPALAGEYGDRVSIGVPGNDYIQIVPLGDEEAELSYHNHVNQASVPGTYHVQTGDIIVDVTLDVSNGDELITIMPRNGYMAYPAEVSLGDGGTATVRIFKAMM